MIRGVLMTAAVAAAADVEASSLLQLNHFAESDGSRIWEASRKTRDGQDVCLSVGRGQRAPIAGVFKAGNEELDVQPGEVAVRAGVFCVPKNTLALLQRSLGLDSAKHVDRALAAKEEPTCQAQIDNVEYPPKGLLQVGQTEVDPEIPEEVLLKVKEFMEMEIKKAIAKAGLIAEEVTQAEGVLEEAWKEVDLKPAVAGILDAEDCAIKVEEEIVTPPPTPAPPPGKPAFCHTVRYHVDCAGTDDLLAELHVDGQLTKCANCGDVHSACGWGADATTVAPKEKETTETTAESKGR